VNAVSPQAEVMQIPKDTIVRMVVGSDDRLTPPPLTFAFEHSLKTNGNDVQVLVLKNLGHEIFSSRRCSISLLV
jgi:predicted esterase